MRGSLLEALHPALALGTKRLLFLPFSTLYRGENRSSAIRVDEKTGSSIKNRKARVQADHMVNLC